MQLISDAVGEGAANNRADAALVQAILVKTPRAVGGGAAAGTYLTSYDGIAGKDTIRSIRDFQNDHVFVSPDGRQSMDNPKAKAGRVAPNDATWGKLLELVPTEFQDMRILPKTRTVYVAATAQELQAKRTAAAALTFAPVFRIRLNEIISRMHARHGIAVGVCPQGDRRTFQQQYDLLTNGRNVTRAGPGESNHNYGMAADFGFQGLKWLRADGSVTTNETWWLHRLSDVRPTDALALWEALRKAGIASGAFRGPIADRPHLQNWSDQGVDMAARLAVLLTQSGTMRWRGEAQRYQCDLGYGGNLVAVGRANQIWNRQPTLTLAHMQQARASARPSPQQPAGQPALVAPDHQVMIQRLRADFDAADAAWQNWTPS